MILTAVLEPSSSAIPARPRSTTASLRIGYIPTTACKRPSSHVFFKVDPSFRSSIRRCSCIHMRSSTSSCLPSVLAATITVSRKWRAGVRRGRTEGARDSVQCAEIWIVLRFKWEIVLWRISSATAVAKIQHRHAPNRDTKIDANLVAHKQLADSIMLRVRRGMY